MIKNLLVYLIGVCVCIECISQKSFQSIRSDATPFLFADAKINTAMNERDIAISPDGTEMFSTGNGEV